MDIQEVPALVSGERPETGPMRFGEDWPGCFIRGDNAFHFAMNLKSALSKLSSDNWMEARVLTSLLDILKSCQIGGPFAL